MTNFRSPNYPALGLRESYQRAKSLWNKERRTAVPPDVAARAIGYNGLSGPSRTALAAMKKYGIVENDGSNVKVSELTIDLIHRTTDEDALKIMRVMALKPELFAYLFANYRHASDDAIRSYLIAKLNFSDSGAVQAIKAYRDTVSFARLDDPEYNPPAEQEDGNMEATQTTWVRSSQPSASVAGAPSLSNTTVSTSSQTFNVPLSPDVKAEVKITGTQILPEHLAYLRQYLELAERAMQPFAEGDTVEFEDAYTGEQKYGRITRAYGSRFIISTITKDEAGPNPKRFSPKPDARIAAITGGTGIINN